MLHNKYTVLLMAFLFLTFGYMNTKGSLSSSWKPC